MENKGEIIIYESADHQALVEVKFEDETVWLSQDQMALLFQKAKSTVNEHIKNIYKEGELEEKSTKSKFGNSEFADKPTFYYNLDVIISVGYRVNSRRGTQFRIWATQRLKDYLVKGYAINEKRLQQMSQNLRQLEQTIQFISEGSTNETLQLQEAKGLLEILSNYTKSFVLLNQYDSQSLHTTKLSENITYEIQYDEAKAAISELRKQLIVKNEAANLFGNEKDASFKSSLQSIIQTFDGQYLYPSIEEQAAHLLYFVIKNHSFSDGNKRIGAFFYLFGFWKKINTVLNHRES